MGMELDVAQPLLLAPGEGETTTDRPERTLRILCELEQLIVSWFRYEPGEHGPDPHIHRQHADAFYVLEGEVDFGLGPDVTRITVGPETVAGAPVEHETTSHRIQAELPELSVIEMTFRPEFEGVDPHTHDDLVDAFYVLAGEADFVVGNEARRAGPGSFLAAQPGARHGFSNPGPADLRVLNFHAPDAGFVGRLRS